MKIYKKNDTQKTFLANTNGLPTGTPLIVVIGGKEYETVSVEGGFKPTPELHKAIADRLFTKTSAT